MPESAGPFLEGVRGTGTRALKDSRTDVTDKDRAWVEVRGDAEGPRDGRQINKRQVGHEIHAGEDFTNSPTILRERGRSQ